MDGSAYLKLLLPSQLAYANLLNLDPRTSGCNISVGPTRGVSIPLTDSRTCAVVLIVGSAVAVERIIDYIVTMMPQNMTMEMRIVVPNSAVPPIMGKGGAKITSIRDSSGAKIQISGRDSGRHEFERIVLVAGSIEQVRTATKLVCSIIQVDSSLPEHMTTELRLDAEGPVDMTSKDVYIPESASMLSLSKISSEQAGDPADPGTWIQHTHIKPVVMQLETTIHIQVPDEKIGALMGRQGQVLTDIRSLSGATITISRRGELVPGTRDRLVTIRGTLVAIHTAHALLIQRLAESQDERKAAGCT